MGDHIQIEEQRGSSYNSLSMSCPMTLDVETGALVRHPPTYKTPRVVSMAYHSAHDGLSNISDVHDVQTQVRRAGHLGAEELGAYVDARRHIGRKSGSDD